MMKILKKSYSAHVFFKYTEYLGCQAEGPLFERYIQAGGGFVGVHAATDTEYDWNWYGRLGRGLFCQPILPVHQKRFYY